jgi:hypothetical protein
VRPGRADIPLPPLPPGVSWIGGDPESTERLTARGPLLVHFFEAGELSGVQTLPHVEAWAKTYFDSGLRTIGVHSPRNDLARQDPALKAALARLDISFPVANDREYRIWHAFGCKGWPSLFLFARGGVLRWFHLGLGEWAETEEAIRTELLTPDSERELPPRLEDPVPTVSELVKPSDEVYPGGDHETPWRGAPGEPLEVEYTGGGAFASLDGEGTVTVTVDGEGPSTSFELAGPGVYTLAEHERHGIHEVRLDLAGDVRVWSVAFSPGPP